MARVLQWLNARPHRCVTEKTCVRASSMKRALLGSNQSHTAVRRDGPEDNLELLESLRLEWSG